MLIRRRKLDEHLTGMIIVRVEFLVAMTLPYVFQRIYTLSVVINISLFYLNYSVF
jgi:hypothetical protein